MRIRNGSTNTSTRPDGNPSRVVESTVSVGAGRAGWRLGVVEAGVQHVGASAQNIRFTKAHIRKYTNTQIRKYTNTSGSSKLPCRDFTI